MDGESTNLALIRRLYNDCWVQGRFELMAEILDPEIVWTAIESAPDAGTRRGYRDCQAYMEDWIGGFELEPQSIEAAGTGADGRLVCDHRAVGTERRSRLRTDIHYAVAYRFAPDGRIAEIHEYATVDDAIAAGGQT